jgi:putative oxidoreductase
VSTTAGKKARDARPRSRANKLLWTAQVLLAAFFVFAAVPKLAGAQSAVTTFDQVGAGQWLRYFVGAAELAGAIGLLIPRLAGLAAVGLAVDMAGATILNITLLHSNAFVMTALLCAAFTLIARSRWEQVRSLVTAIRR